MLKEINIIFDGPPSHKGGRFIEVEDQDGKGINTGRWQQVCDYSGFWKLTITPADFYTAAELEHSESMLKKVDAPKNP